MTTLYSYDGSPSGIDFDPSRKKIYWADYELDTIFRGDLNGEHIETLVNFTRLRLSYFQVLLMR